MSRLAHSPFTFLTTKLGSPAWDRTTDTLINSQVQLPLCYWGINLSCNFSGKLIPVILKTSPCWDTPIMIHSYFFGNASIRFFYRFFRWHRILHYCLVRKERLELSILSALASKTSVYTIPPLAHAYYLLVSVQGFEPWTPSSQTKCATRLRYTEIILGGDEWNRATNLLRMKELHYRCATSPILKNTKQAIIS